MYISDEVVTAFGRLGEMFASEAVFNVTPDVLVCAKGISSGYAPLGATLFSDEIYDVLEAIETESMVFLKRMIEKRKPLVLMEAHHKYCWESYLIGFHAEFVPADEL